MTPLIVLFLLPLLVGIVSAVLFRSIGRAAFAATIASPLLVCLCLRLLDRDGTLSWFAALLVSPLVIAPALVAALLWLGRSQGRKRETWHDA